MLTCDWLLGHRHAHIWCFSTWPWPWEQWIESAFWGFLFSIILLVIMFLWRPSANNQRYAFSPLVDEESEEEEKEPMMNESQSNEQGSNGFLKPLEMLEIQCCVFKV
uniref:Uncharacterized protein n=1 Tax=Sphaeramia orbicularis TaxID=375764 RepID=A0A672YB93_9TELE